MRRHIPIVTDERPTSIYIQLWNHKYTIFQNKYYSKLTVFPHNTIPARPPFGGRGSMHIQQPPHPSPPQRKKAFTQFFLEKIAGAGQRPAAARAGPMMHLFRTVPLSNLCGSCKAFLNFLWTLTLAAERQCCYNKTRWTEGKALVHAPFVKKLRWGCAVVRPDTVVFCLRQG